MTTAAPFLEIRGLCKDYAVRVLDEVDFDLYRGEIHALLGANGAGKSTLSRIIAGLLPASAGTMRLHNRVYAPRQKQEAEAAGVEIVQQELNLVPTLTIAENLFFTRLPQRWGRIRQTELRQRAAVALQRVGLGSLPPDRLVEELGVGHQQLVEIATALDRDCRVLILDEPTAALSGAETETLFTWLDRLRQQGVAILYISHRLDEVARLADRITVLRDGRRIDSRTAEHLDSEAMIRLMTGESSEASAASFRSFATPDPIFQVHGLCRADRVQDVSFSLHAGERLGIAGLVGSGRTEFLRTLFGADRADTGMLRWGTDRPRAPYRHPAAAVRDGLAMVTEDRKQNGLLLSQSIRVNGSLVSLGRMFTRHRVIDRRAEQEAVQDLRERLAIHCQSIEQAVETLSGGNQQKVAVGKWLLGYARVLLFDEPTRGIDIGARRRLYRLFETLAEAGKGIVIVSSDMEELEETCDRIADEIHRV